VYEVATARLAVLLIVKNGLTVLKTATKSESGGRLGTNPSQHSFQKLSPLFLVRVRSGQEKGFTYAGDTLTFASRDCFNLSLHM
jgi:hypothetical protein